GHGVSRLHSRAWLPSLRETPFRRMVRTGGRRPERTVRHPGRRETRLRVHAIATGVRVQSSDSGAPIGACSQSQGSCVLTSFVRRVQLATVVGPLLLRFADGYVAGAVK